MKVGDALNGLRLGEAQVYRNLAIFPLMGDDGAPANYMLLDEALEKNLAEVTEVSQSGSVPNLAFENKSESPILLVEGDELRGAKQNRILNLTIYVAPGAKIEIPVSCIEQGRWNYTSTKFSGGTQGGGGMLFAKARAANYHNVSYSLTANGSAVGNQADVWGNVAAKLASTQTESSTKSLSDAYTKKSGDLKQYEKAFTTQPKQRGAVVCIDGKPVGMELFSTQAAFQKFLTKLVRSYALDAIETAGSNAPDIDVDGIKEDAEAFLKDMHEVAPKSFQTVGEGESLRWDGSLVGGARVVDGSPVHIASFKK